MVDAVKKYSGVDFNEINTLEEARAAAKEHHVEFEDSTIRRAIFLTSSSRNLLRNTLFSLLSLWIIRLKFHRSHKKKPENPDYVERFEFFMNGWEMANAYSELNDPIDQRERFKAQEELLRTGR